MRAYGNGFPAYLRQYWLYRCNGGIKWKKRIVKKMFLRIGWVGWELTNLGWATCWLLYCTVNAIFSLILSAITVLAQFMTRVMQAEAKQHKRFPPRFSKIRLKYSSEKLWLNDACIFNRREDRRERITASQFCNGIYNITQPPQWTSLRYIVKLAYSVRPTILLCLSDSGIGWMLHIYTATISKLKGSFPKFLLFDWFTSETTAPPLFPFKTHKTEKYVMLTVVIYFTISFQTQIKTTQNIGK